MAYVEIEKYDSWRWFLEILLRDIGSYDEGGCAFISDRQKGLIEAISELAPQAEHRYCLRHMYNNFKLKFRGLNMRDLFWSVTSTANMNEHHQIMQTINEKYPITQENEVTPYVWLNRIPAHHWARSHFPTRTKYNVLVNNLYEPFNSYILEARDLPIISMWEWIRSKFMNRIQVKRMAMLKYEKVICPNILKKIEKQVELCMNCFPSWVGDEKFEALHRENNHVVMLNNKYCSCGMFQLSGYPCCHAMAAMGIVDWK